MLTGMFDHKTAVWVSGQGKNMSLIRQRRRNRPERWVTTLENLAVEPFPSADLALLCGFGPDLDGIGRAERANLLGSILRPGNNVAPRYQAWVVTKADGRTHTGLLVKTHLDESTYVDAQGARFTLRARDVVESRPARTSNCRMVASWMTR